LSSQEHLNAQLAAEQEKNAGNIAEIDQLQAGYNEKLAAFEEVKHHMDALIKDSKKFEKEEVGLAEKKKHLITKQKKLKKSIAEVSGSVRVFVGLRVEGRVCDCAGRSCALGGCVGGDQLCRGDRQHPQ
jgi:structural maintenance of chromosome 4